MGGCSSCPQEGCRDKKQAAPNGLPPWGGCPLPPLPTWIPAPGNPPQEAACPRRTQPSHLISRGCLTAVALPPCRAWSQGSGRVAPTADPHPVHLHQVSSGSPGQTNSPVGLGEALRSHGRAGAAPRLPGHFGARSNFSQQPFPHWLKQRRATVQRRWGSPRNLTPVWESRAKDQGQTAGKSSRAGLAAGMTVCPRS